MKGGEGGAMKDEWKCRRREPRTIYPIPFAFSVFSISDCVIEQL